MKLVIQYAFQVLEGYPNSVRSGRAIQTRHEQVLQFKIEEVSIIIKGKLYAQEMQLFEQYNKICKYFAKRKQKDNDPNEI